MRSRASDIPSAKTDSSSASVSAGRPVRRIDFNSARRSPSFDSATCMTAFCSIGRGGMEVHDVVDGLANDLHHVVAQRILAEHFAALLVDRLALLVDDVIELQDVLAQVEVVAFDLDLRLLDGFADEPMLDRHI